MKLSRRRFLQALGAGSASVPLMRSRYAFAAPTSDSAASGLLVVVNLRGGLDGLSALVPVGEANYYDTRSTVSIPAQQCIALDTNFALHPALAPLAGLYQAGHLAFVPAAGSPDASRSHFDQQDLVDRGVTDPNETTGWLSRHLSSTSGGSGLDAVTVVPALPYTLAGDPTAVAVGALDEFALRPLIDDNPASSATLAALSAGSPLEGPTNTALAQLAATAARRPAMLQPGGGAVYEDHPWSSQFRQIAQLAHAGIGLCAAVVETVGWDLHADMGTATEGTMRDLLGH